MRRSLISLTAVALTAFVLAPTDTAAAETVAFGPGDHRFVVPTGVESLTIVASGGQGGPGTGSVATVGGAGGRVTFTLAVSAGDEIDLEVGAYASGAIPANNLGGGRTVVSQNGTVVAIAGGGGGAGNGGTTGLSGYDGIETYGGDGGPGGGTASGGDGETYTGACTAGLGGAAGAVGGAGGAGGTGDFGTGSAGGNGGLDGDGGRPQFNGFWSAIAGTGGDGAVGGGAGGNGGLSSSPNVVCGAGGGGGGSSTGPAGSVLAAGVQEGDGEVTITYDPPVSPSSSTPGSSTTVASTAPQPVTTPRFTG